MSVSELKEEMEKDETNVIAVVGAGASIAATKNAQCASWKGLLENGISKLETSNPNLDEESLDRRRKDIESKDVDEIISAATYIRKKLENNNQWNEWIKETVGNLEVKNEELIDSINDLDVPILTTNYDGLIDKHLNRPHATWKDHRQIQEVLRGEKNHVVHIHGYWRDADSVILDFVGYDKIKKNDPFQRLFQGSAALHSFLFIGVGDGLRDPHFKNLFNWIDQFLKEESDHYLLVRRDKKSEFQEKYSKNNISVISYGENYDCLSEFLESVAPSGADRNRIPKLSTDSVTSKSGFLIPHPVRVKRLNAQKHESFLLSDNLEFVEPEGKEYHPSRILDRLDNPDSPDGALLVGPGGVGKSRILIETATRAHERDGWQVLHTVATSQLDNRTLQANLDDRTREDNIVEDSDVPSILLVVDQLNEVDLDFPDLQERVLPDFDRGLKILACARPAYYRHLKDNNELDLFGGDEKLIWMRPEHTRSQEISTLIQEKVAPRAIDDLGEERVDDLCGNRPAIALLIARELETRAEEKREIGEGLGEEDLQGIRDGELSTWLEKRLKEDDLKREPGPSIVGRPTGTERLLAATAVVAAAPAEDHDLVDVAMEVLSEHTETPRPEGRYLVEDLKELGWLEEQELDWEGSSPDAKGLAPAHDVVTDELLDKVFLQDPTSFPQKHLEQLLSPCANALVVWSNMTQTLSRLLGHTRERKDRKNPLEQTFSERLDEWLEDNGSELAQSSFSMSWRDKYRSSRALSAALDAGLWSDDLLVEKLALPWLRKYSSEYQLAHFLLVRVLETGCSLETIANKSLDWIDNHIYNSNAPFVIYKISKCLSGDCEQSERTSKLGVRWLEMNNRRNNRDIYHGQFILTSLLSWNNKPREDDLIYWSLQWLDKYGKKPRAWYVIYTLLNQIDLKEKVLSDVREYTISWLDENRPYHKSGSYLKVLNILLENGDLEAIRNIDRFQLIKKGVDLLCEPRTYQCDGWTYLLETLLEHDYLDENDRQKIIESVDKWITKHQYKSSDDWTFAYEEILDRKSDIGGDDNFVEAGIKWLDSYDSFQNRSWRHIFTSMIEHPDIEMNYRRELFKLGKKWLRENGREQDDHRGYVYAKLLGCRWLNRDSASNLIASTTRWLTKNPTHEEWRKAYNSANQALDQLPQKRRNQYEQMLKNAANIRQQELNRSDNYYAEED